VNLGREKRSEKGSSKRGFWLMDLMYLKVLRIGRNKGFMKYFKKIGKNGE